ncbi:hypothetical protein KPSA1_03717 [Pseudomonas syringae pv. actinidiae]|uniref:Uncharacterized protein n=1 Tax=Pseudomonas syringae pv. actinidiae TaxID=103796 RepID=A0A2V0QM46_PSESF|nr:hypothetical protein KPSA1_03717 [Pseudomonas syringae pv. actinidiae]
MSGYFFICRFYLLEYQQRRNSLSANRTVTKLIQTLQLVDLDGVVVLARSLLWLH